MPSLVIRHADGSQETHHLTGSSVTFGRSGENELKLDASGISRRHGRFSLNDQGAWEVEDFGSTNGTRVNGEDVSRRLLRHGDVVGVGSFAIVFHDVRLDAHTARSVASSVTFGSDSGLSPPTIERPVGSAARPAGRRLAALYEFARRLLTLHNVEELLEEASAALRATLDAGVTVFGLTLDPEREPDRLVVHPPASAAQITLSRSVVRRTLDAGDGIVIADTAADPALARQESIVSQRIGSALCVPLLRGQAVDGFLYIDNRGTGSGYREEDLDFACALGAILGTALENIRFREAEIAQERIRAELDQARRVQQTILPARWPQIDGWDIWGEHRACHEVGGDCYDALVADDGHVWLYLADVQGKGVPAALRASGLHSLTRVLVDHCETPSELLSRLNELMLTGEGELLFATCVMMRIDPRTGRVLMATAGHPPPVHVRGHATPREVPVPPGFPLAVDESATYEDVAYALGNAGEGLVVFSDGLIEAQDDQGELFGTERVFEGLGAVRGSPSRDVIRHLQSQVDRFRSERAASDDLTLLMVRRT